MKNHPLRVKSHILAIALATTSLSSAATLISENFEGSGTANIFGMPTYAYTANYTQANTQTPSPGLRYAHGGEPAGGSGVNFTSSFAVPTLTLTSFGFSTAQIDSGNLSFNLAAQFSTYSTQNDYAVVSVQFRDATSTNIGSPVQIGSSALVAALPSNGASTPLRGWTTDSLSGSVPVGTREVVVTMFQTKTPQGTYTDGYVDNVSLTVVPEPSSMLLSLVGGMFLLRRRK